MPALIADVERGLQPANRKWLLAQLTRLMMLYPMRDVPEAGYAMLADDYLESLSVYPADIVAQGIRQAKETSKFRPTIAELVEPMKREVYRRKALKFCLQAIAAKRDEPPPPRMTDSDAITRERERLEASMASEPVAMRQVSKISPKVALTAEQQAELDAMKRAALAGLGLEATQVAGTPSDPTQGTSTAVLWAFQSEGVGA